MRVINEHVVQLQVSMNYRQGMHIRHRAHNLSKYWGCLRLWDPRVWLPLFDEVVERLAQAQLHDQMHVRPRVDDFVEPHDILVVDGGQHVDLPM